MKNKRFENIHKVSDIVDTMIRGLKKEWVKVKMNTFGQKKDGICFGCAATNTLCELMQESFSLETIENRATQFNYDISIEDLSIFEVAIDALRGGFLDEFCAGILTISDVIGISLTEKNVKTIYSYPREGNWLKKERYLPCLNSYNYLKNLHYYEEFRDWLIKKGL